MLRWFGVTEGDEVILPAYTYTATANVVVHCGAKPVLVDIGHDFNLNVQKLKAAITPKTKVIIPVDFGGYPCDYDAIMQVVTDIDVRRMFIPANENQVILNRIMVLSDAAHSIGDTYNGKPSAQMSDTTVFSFHAVKNVTTAEGGAICINLPPPFDNDGLYKWLRLLSLNGQTKDAFTKSQGGNWRYDIIYPGFKMKLKDICAAVGLAQIRKYEQDLHQN